MRFARRLGLKCGIWNWWEIKQWHTSYEWAVQMILDEVEPLDANRDDMRAATNTAELIAWMSAGAAEGQRDAIAENLRRYLPLHNRHQEDAVLTPEQAESIKAKYRE